MDHSNKEQRKSDDKQPGSGPIMASSLEEDVKYIQGYRHGKQLKQREPPHVESTGENYYQQRVKQSYHLDEPLGIGVDVFLKQTVNKAEKEYHPKSKGDVSDACQQSPGEVGHEF